MLNRFRWYRKWKGGYWVKYHFLGWTEVTLDTYYKQGFHGRKNEKWENWTKVNIECPICNGIIKRESEAVQIINENDDSFYIHEWCEIILEDL